MFLMWKKIGLWGLGLLVVCLTLFGWNGTKVAKADDLTNHFHNLTSPSAIYLDLNDGTLGQKITTDDPMNYEFKSGDNYNIVYDYTVDDGTTIHDGDTVSVPLPKNIPAAIDSFPMFKDPTAAVLDKIGTFSREAGEENGTMFFSNALEGVNTFTAGKLVIGVTGTSVSSGSGDGGGTSVIAKGGGVGETVEHDDVAYPTTANWNGYFNSKNKNMGKVTLTDHLGKYLMFDPTTFSASIAATDTEPEVKLQEGQDYTISYKGSEIEIVFQNITKKVNYSYVTDVDTSQILADGLSGGYLSNYIELAAKDGESGEASTVPGAGSNPDVGSVLGNDHKDAHWGAAGIGYLNGSAFLGQVLFTKTDETNKSNVLAGAVYTLQRQNADGLTWTDEVTHYTTNDNGQISIPSIQVGNYRFKETKAPDGYQLNTGDTAYSYFTIKIDDGTTFVHDVSQSDVPYTVTLTKTAKSTKKPLAGAVYKLYKADDLANPVNKLTYTTDTNGQLTISPIAKGSYDFIEQTPPAGYKLDQTPIPFTISDDKQSTPSNDGPNAVVSQADESSIPTPGTDTGSSGSSSSNSSNSSDSSSSSSTSSSSSSSSTSTSSSTRTSTSTSTSSSNSVDSSSRHGDRVGSTPVPRVSSSTHGGGAGTITGNQASSAKHHSQANGLLPKTNEAKSIFAALGGLLLIGGSLSVWQYRRTRKN